MTMPEGIKAIDLMLSIPGEDNSDWYEFMKPLLMDEESRQMFSMPAQYMFKDIPHAGKQEDFVQYTIEQMDKNNPRSASWEILNHGCHAHFPENCPLTGFTAAGLALGFDRAGLYAARSAATGPASGVLSVDHIRT